MNRISRTAALLALLGMLPALDAQAGWTVLNHNGDSLLAGTARCVVAPTTHGNRLRISRIRLTRTGTADVTHQFSFKVTEDAQGDTESLAVCPLPDCRTLLTVEGATEGMTYDLDGLNILLPPGGRLYVAEDSHQASQYATIEVFYTES